MLYHFSSLYIQETVFSDSTWKNDKSYANYFNLIIIQCICESKCHIVCHKMYKYSAPIKKINKIAF
jgi:hypothetical protein